MTREDVVERVQEIRSLSESQDDEAAHGKENELYADVLQHIADSAPGPWSELAREALQTKKLDFYRWTA